jgi:hypothetical protein
MAPRNRGYVRNSAPTGDCTNRDPLAAPRGTCPATAGTSDLVPVFVGDVRAIARDLQLAPGCCRVDLPRVSISVGTNDTTNTSNNTQPLVIWS